jgi:hypothetical protein
MVLPCCTGPVFRFGGGEGAFLWCIDNDAGVRRGEDGLGDDIGKFWPVLFIFKIGLLMGEWPIVEP